MNQHSHAASSEDATSRPASGGCCSGARREFISKCAAIAAGGVLFGVPLAAGLSVLLDPLRRKGTGAAAFLPIAPLDAVPDDGIPHPFPVLADRVDAWNYYPRQQIGTIYLRRQKGTSRVEALSSVCPHLGCFIDYLATKNEFFCPCHNSAFKVDGEIIQPSKSPRPMDGLTAEVRAQGDRLEVWVQFENFYTGTPDKVVKA